MEHASPEVIPISCNIPSIGGSDSAHAGSRVDPAHGGISRRSSSHGGSRGSGSAHGGGRRDSAHGAAGYIRPSRAEIVIQPKGAAG
mmetsp:Transcript_17447/g.34733  ORF Transcript_17447/g.34733 Transcript_17447/m.34733 type:complete len:86 (-) Transcript_17447:58-315(-)